MLHLLLSRGFVARTVMKAYFGADRDRLYCQLGVRHRFVDPDDQYLVPAEALDNLYKLLEMDNYVLTDVLSSPAGTLFEVSRFDSEDLAALQAAEAAAGISFSTAMLASLSFLLAFAFASARYPEGARVLLLIATLSCTASLIVYANASGDLARLRSNTFDQYMKWGNLLSEYGGVTPFILALPLTFANVTTSEPAAIGIAVLFSAALLIYELSRFALLKRYPRTILFVAPAIATSALPILSVLIPDEHPWTWIWTGAAVLLLFGRIMIALPSGAGEAVTPPKRWQVRR